MFAPDRPRCLRIALLIFVSTGFGLGQLGCFGGPTSDLPSKVDEQPGSGDNGGNDNGGNNGGGDGDGEGSTGGAAGSNGSGANQDAGVGAAPDDSGQDAGDSGAPVCTWNTPAVSAVSCGGTHCGLSRAQLSAMPGSVCEPAQSLDVVCTGDPQRVAHACWRNNMLSLDRQNAVRMCAAADPLLMLLNAACLECYVAMHECVSTACAVECAMEGEGSGECEPCTNQKCGPAFSTCSGLATP